ncbi:MAG TPA: oxygenase MpaB family protein [Acidimicrobiales bacterium]|nr:MAG: hypothetical protein B7Z69_01915 [Actinobacteria bacterium 21-73-9]HQU26356.1 oxygenase MpaB family protein [Acidimicrobiales bacterium]
MTTPPRVLAERLRARAGQTIRRAAGLVEDPPARCDDPAIAYTPVDGVARVVHGDLGSMLVGGVASLFVQMLHPLAMAGVADHSRYQEDPLGRLLQTAHFISATTYGSRASAEAALERVRFVHGFVHGTADDGRPYDARDPHLLAFVHCAEVSMFLAAYRRLGRYPITDADADRYVAEVATAARDLGVPDPPTTAAGLSARLASFRPELRLSDAAREARDFLERGVSLGPVARLAYRVIVRAALALLEGPERRVLGAARPSWRDAAALAVARMFAAAVRAVLPPAAPQVVESPPSTAST